MENDSTRDSSTNELMAFNAYLENSRAIIGDSKSTFDPEVESDDVVTTDLEESFEEKEKERINKLNIDSMEDFWKTRGSKNVQDYVKGGNTTKWWTIGLSVMATQASAITFLSTIL